VSGVTVNGGTLELQPAQTRVLRAASISIAAGARLDIQDNKLITATPVGTWNGTAFTDVSGMIASGRNGGDWSGSGGIVTSQSDAIAAGLTSIGIATAQQVKGISASETATWAGQTVSGSDTLVMYTYAGDANLDGKINVDDYGRIDLNIPLGTSGWFNGDFNYDGTINVDDYGIIDFNVGIQGAAFPTSTNVGGRIVAAAVPEPSTPVLVGLALALCGGIRGRKPRPCRPRERHNKTVPQGLPPFA